jgi:hypothetical protein
MIWSIIFIFDLAGVMPSSAHFAETSSGERSNNSVAIVFGSVCVVVIE